MNKIMKNLKNLIKKNENIEYFLKIGYFKFHAFFENLIPTETFLKMQYLTRTGSRLNLDEPVSFNEKVQWLKVYYRNPILKKCVDKWAVRDYVESKGLKNLLIPAWGPYSTVGEINQSHLPGSFIMKLTNGSGFNIICPDKSDFDWAKAERKFNKWVGVNFYAARREWAYKDVPNRIMCETLLSSDDGGLPSDIRVFCFSGEPKFIAVDLDSVVDGVKTSNYHRHIYDVDWNPMEATIGYPKKDGYEMERPKNLPEIIRVARILAEDFPLVRVDLYSVNENIYFGELTFYHASGYQKFSPEEFGTYAGKLIDLKEF